MPRSSTQLAGKDGARARQFQVTEISLSNILDPARAAAAGRAQRERRGEGEVRARRASLRARLAHRVANAGVSGA